jgi:hypothetical protein
VQISLEVVRLSFSSVAEEHVIFELVHTKPPGVDVFFKLLEIPVVFLHFGDEGLIRHGIHERLKLKCGGGVIISVFLCHSVQSMAHDKMKCSRIVVH